MNVYWLEQAAADVPGDLTWLGDIELNHLRTLRFVKRREDWLLGRWTAKNAVASYLAHSAELRALADIEIRQQASGAPQAFCKAEPIPISISLSHRAGLGACAVAPGVVRLGCDLEIAEPHSDGFLTDYFTVVEQTMVVKADPADRFWLLPLLWSAKESVLKALGEGLRLDTRDLTVMFSEKARGDKDGDLKDACSITAGLSRSSSWNPIQVQKLNAQIFNGWWNRTGARLRTVVGVPAPAPPTFLRSDHISGAPQLEAAWPSPSST